MSAQRNGKIILCATGCCFDYNDNSALGVIINKGFNGPIPNEVANADRVDVTEAIQFIPVSGGDR